MKKKSAVVVAVAVVLTSCILGCQSSGNKVWVDEKEIQGFKVKTFFSREKIEVATASDGTSTIVAVPKAAVSRGNGIGEGELNCLKDCIKNGDLEGRLNCILLCPISKEYQVFIFAPLR